MWSAVLVMAACGARSPLAMGSADAGGPPGNGAARDAGAPRDAGHEVPICQECRMRGWSCDGPGSERCCDGEPCAQVAGRPGWYCGGVRAGGEETTCPFSDEDCRWETTEGCEEYGPIADFCGAGRYTAALRRCDGTCFVPDALYQQFWPASCELAEDRDLCPQEHCSTFWAAVFCCAD